MAVRNPWTKRFQYFIDKCLPFGASISCAIFQRFSNALKHIAQVRLNSENITNYLDIFLFVSYMKTLCNEMVDGFLNICQQIGVPIANDKTVWATTSLVFLGILLNGINMTLGIPEEKRTKAIYLLNKIIHKKKTTVKEIQSLCGYLNFLNHAIFPGRVFMRRMYAKYAHLCNKKQNNINTEVTLTANTNLKPYHHIRIDSEFKADCRIWVKFLDDTPLAQVVCCPMLDIDANLTDNQIEFYTDASATISLGYGCVYQDRWTYGHWEQGFIEEDKPSIEFLELYALTVGLFTWQNYLTNCKIVIHCDNQAVVSMVNSLSSKCPRCMFLLRLITLNGLRHNCRVGVVYIKSSENKLSDALSCLDWKHFARESNGKMRLCPDQVDPMLISARKIFNLSKYITL